MFLSIANSKSLFETRTKSRASWADAYTVLLSKLVSLAINWRSQPQNTRPIIAILEKPRHEKSLNPLR